MNNKIDIHPEIFESLDEETKKILELFSEPNFQYFLASVKYNKNFLKKEIKKERIIILIMCLISIGTVFGLCQIKSQQHKEESKQLKQLVNNSLYELNQGSPDRAKTILEQVQKP